MEPFVVKLILSFLVGGLYATFVIWISERFGSKIGGLLLGLPSTSLVGLIFIAWTQGSTSAVSATPIIPAAISACSLFVVLFVILYPKLRGVVSFISAILFWAVLTIPLILIHLNNIVISSVIGIFYLSVALLLVRNFPDQKLVNIKVTPEIILIRGITSGSIISLAVILSKLLGPLWGGLMSSFPALFASSMIIILKAHGIKFTSAVAKKMPYGNITSAIFAVGIYFFVPYYGMGYGTVFAYSMAILTAIILYYIVFPYQDRAK